ncbi:16S rRNA (adenine(1518)-N(6)/adenine(1519)-N(6))-dimethyltransferase RsmA [Corynebacterium sp. 153RC1]|uniref:16S rRNA (adenine(1518)-N(6)/adenine(1519)-N(6))- dimethyltransferase RsmA n=1 Tax=Corynebacterium TaxID=1716 RepID=UPI00211C0067|nr:MULTISPECIES: 16S rRNA (adenine(1518)-N(6)/adenine(1519)-N(6))-dimethyltransferase RsmA [unclassified Corynebacterium]MCQ9371045.1 16S rRNA (adenine(1518)-N(6)/adenine(1519)-N(6))-dimethyltransferase RsmA [Corynebacterium sp. 35RC1]MCQ9343928.1 16S rRNA (adenine(1518)-N(6)/adenine(1519)-N(6))-dimethyltransferase RsmA [Corynebacterium sp. 76QC2CO]MCQ9352598.1 16S rRNA (adenine(1518)-N(6)/adenine(1519)-N(6))-dimethyltransferase RsmA [Corynebacterium sp. 209RC1]MCQ9354782.1 16S rRNA (adenine(15
METHVALLGPQEIRTLAEALEVQPTKKLGQNFVHDPNTVRMIVAAAEITEEDHVIEVGPGLGSLTLALLDTAHQVTAVEIDPRLAAQLPITVAQRAAQVADRLTIIERDALKIQEQDIHQPTALVANLPYNVSVPVLLHLLRIFPSIRRVLVMVQAEVADRLAATPGSKIYGVPSVKAAFYGSVRRAGSIGKNVFWPAPKIESGLVRIDCFAPGESPWPVTEELRAQVFPIVDAAFAQRRKTLRSALKPLVGAEVLEAAGVDPSRRGETLGVEEYIRIALAQQAVEGGGDA